MRQEVEVVLRMLLKADSTIPPGGRIDHAIDVLNGTTHGQDRPFLTTMEAAEAPNGICDILCLVFAMRG